MYFILLVMLKEHLNYWLARTSGPIELEHRLDHYNLNLERIASLTCLLFSITLWKEAREAKLEKITMTAIA